MRGKFGALNLGQVCATTKIVSKLVYLFYRNLCANASKFNGLTQITLTFVMCANL